MVRTMDVVPYDPNWADLYETEKKLLEKVFGGLILDIQHFGSTSVTGLSAKPIIDIMILVKNIEEVDWYNDDITAAGYTVRGENGIPGRRYFVKMKEDGSGTHTYHVHIYEKENEQAQNELMFRDYLRIDEDSRKEYERCKLELSVKFYHSPGEYTDGKTGCIIKIMEKAKRYYKTQEIDKNSR